MNQNQPGIGPASPEGQPVQPPKKEEITQPPGEAPEPVQPTPPEARPQPPISEAGPIQAQPKVRQVGGAPVQTAEVPPLNPDQAAEAIKRLIATDQRTVTELAGLANGVEQTILWT